MGFRILGIDPGAASPSGAVYQALDDGGGKIVHVFDIPMRGEKGTRHRGPDPLPFVDIIQTWGVTKVVVEDVWAMPSIEDPNTGERRGMGAQSSWNFGAACGDIRTTIRCCGIEPMFVIPPTWKSAFGLKGSNKEQSRQLALDLFPEIAESLARKKDEGRAEACLIARWGAMFIQGRFDSPGKIRSTARQRHDIDDEIVE